MTAVKTPPVKVPFLDLHGVNARFREELLAAAARVIDGGWLVHGQEHAAFEREFAAYCGSPACLGVANGLDALILIFRAYRELGRLHEGDEVRIEPDPEISWRARLVVSDEKRGRRA